MPWLLIFGAFILAIIFLSYKSSRNHGYWHEKGIQFVDPFPVVGNLLGLLLRMQSLPETVQDAYNVFQNERYFGFYQFLMPCLVIKDVDLIKQICIKDFDYFTSHQRFLTKGADSLTNKMLFILKGEDWRNLRNALNPIFTSDKLEPTFDLMRGCAEEFADHFHTNGNIIKIEMKDAFQRVLTDMIASTAFGVKCDSLKCKQSKFYALAKSQLKSNGLKLINLFGYTVSSTFTKKFETQFSRTRLFDFFSKVVGDQIRRREKSGEIRPDLIHLLREVQKKVADNKGETEVTEDTTVLNGNTFKRKEDFQFNEEDITAQAMSFFVNGLTTVASLLSFLSYELAVNNDAQMKLIEEIEATSKKCNGKITYKALLEMKYLDMLISETLRLWPAVPFLTRKCTKEYTIEAEHLREEPLTLEKGDTCLIPIFSIHRDPKYYKEPNAFDPERFSDENKDEIPEFAYMPFGVGPRNCIASQIALVEAKVILFYLISKFEIIPVEDTEVPLILAKGSMSLDSYNGFRLGLKPRTH